ncbi:hypothetical protein D3C78_1654060 [compost metagenome]
MIPPISVTAVMLRKWARVSGVSRAINTSVRRSFSVTSAARPISPEDVPVAISANVLIEHGATTIPRQRNDPLAIPAATLSARW